MRANHLDLISIAGIESIVNAAADTRYNTAEIMLLLQVKKKKICPLKLFDLGQNLLRRFLNCKFYSSRDKF